MKHAPIPSASDPIKQLSARELLAAIAGLADELETRGALADAPYELTQALDAIAPAAREGLDWLSSQELHLRIKHTPDGYGTQGRWA